MRHPNEAPRAARIRDLLAADRRARGIEGALLVGDLPLARYEDEVAGAYPYPLDYYFEELSGAWADADGWLDGHADPDHGPEIYVGRLKADNACAPELPAPKAYFDRNHAYRNGADLPAPRAFLASPVEHPGAYRIEAA